MYKYSTIPLYAAALMFIYFVKEWNLKYPDGSVSYLLYIVLAAISLFMFIVSIEKEPSLFKDLFPSRLICEGDDFLAQYRVFITYLRWVWIIFFFFAFFIHSNVKKCFSPDMEDIRCCYKDALYTRLTAYSMIALLVLSIGYFVVVKKLSPKHRKEE